MHVIKRNAAMNQGWSWRGIARVLPAPIVLMVLVALAGCNSSDTVATVDGQAVDRKELHSYLEALQGGDALRQLIDYQLLMSDLKSKNLTVTDAEIKDGVDRQVKNDPTLAHVIQTGGPRLDALQRRVQTQLAVEKILTADVKPKDADVKAWFDRIGHSYYDSPEQVSFGILYTTTKARADTMAAQLKAKTKNFMQLVEEQQAAADPAGRQSRADSPPIDAARLRNDPVGKLLHQLKPGDNTGVISLLPRQKAYAIFKVTKHEPAKRADFTKLKNDLLLDYKMEQVARLVVAKNPKNPPFEQTVEQVSQSMMSQGQTFERPAYRQVLTYINQTAVDTLMSSLRQTGKVTINDPAYADLGKIYTTVPGLGGGESAPPATGAEKKPAPAG